MTIAELLANGTIKMNTKVLGTLPMTKDKCVLGTGVFGLCYIRGNRQEVVGPFHCEFTLGGGFSGPQQWHAPDDCYSTREAAEVARKEQA